jgi:hypothetical protein
MLGSEEPVAVCDTAVPVAPHSNAADKMATAEGVIKIDDNLMTMSFQIGRVSRPNAHTVSHLQLAKLSNLAPDRHRNAHANAVPRNARAVN